MDRVIIRLEKEDDWDLQVMGDVWFGGVYGGDLFDRLVIFLFSAFFHFIYPLFLFNE